MAESKTVLQDGVEAASADLVQSATDGARRATGRRGRQKRPAAAQAPAQPAKAKAAAPGAIPPVSKGLRGRTRQSNEAAWRQRLEELKQFMLNHGHGRVPYQTGRGPGTHCPEHTCHGAQHKPLSTWVSKQRKQCVRCVRRVPQAGSHPLFSALFWCFCRVRGVMCG